MRESKVWSEKCSFCLTDFVAHFRPYIWPFLYLGRKATRYSTVCLSLRLFSSCLSYNLIMYGILHILVKHHWMCYAQDWGQKSGSHWLFSETVFQRHFIVPISVFMGSFFKMKVIGPLLLKIRTIWQIWGLNWKSGGGEVRCTILWIEKNSGQCKNPLLPTWNQVI